jgi:hypothetical protein
MLPTQLSVNLSSRITNLIRKLGGDDSVELEPGRIRGFVSMLTIVLQSSN